MNILSFSGFIPEQICDTVRFIQYEGEQTIAHYCGYAADFISQALRDERFDGAVFPRTCDSCRVMASYLSGSQKFIHQLHIPARQDKPAVQYLAANIRQYQRAVEEHYHVTISDVAERAALVNARNRAVAKLYVGITDISYSAYLDAIHHLLQTPLREQIVPENLPGKASNGPSVYLVGSLLSNGEIAAAIEDAGMRIVGDRLTESKRLFSAPPVSAEGDLYENIAASILQNRTSPTQSRFAEILESDKAELVEKRVRGVIFVTQKYCEPYDYLFSVYQKMLDGLHIPALRIVCGDSTERRSFATVLETFADTL